MLLLAARRVRSAADGGAPPHVGARLPPPLRRLMRPPEEEAEGGEGGGHLFNYDLLGAMIAPPGGENSGDLFVCLLRCWNVRQPVKVARQMSSWQAVKLASWPVGQLASSRIAIHRQI
jgi:hypothetical protein